MGVACPALADGFDQRRLRGLGFVAFGFFVNGVPGAGYHFGDQAADVFSAVAAGFLWAWAGAGEAVGFACRAAGLEFEVADGSGKSLERISGPLDRGWRFGFVFGRDEGAFEESDGGFAGPDDIAIVEVLASYGGSTNARAVFALEIGDDPAAVSGFDAAMMTAEQNVADRDFAFGGPPHLDGPVERGCALLFVFIEIIR